MHFIQRSRGGQKMHEILLNQSDVCKRLGGISPTTLWRWQQSGVFPAPKIVPGTSIRRWSESTVNEWIEKNFSDQGVNK